MDIESILNPHILFYQACTVSISKAKVRALQKLTELLDGMEFKLNLKCCVMTTATTKTFFSVINIFTENTCIQNIADNNDAINNNLAEQ